MFRGPFFIMSTMQEETTPIFKRLWYDWTQQQPGIEPTNPLGQCWVPPIIAIYDQQGLLRTYSSPGSSIRSPHPGSPRAINLRKYNEKYIKITHFRHPKCKNFLGANPQNPTNLGQFTSFRTLYSELGRVRNFAL